MTPGIEINGETLQSLKQVAQSLGRTQSQVEQWAKAKKVRAAYIGRQWYVSPNSVAEYVELLSFEQAATERQARHPAPVTSAHLRAHDVLAHQAARASHVQAVGVALLVLGVGITSGGMLGHQLFSRETPQSQIALTPASQPEADIFVPSAQVSAVRHQPVFSEEHAVLSVGTDGILLLPEGGIGRNAAVKPEEYFSDDVVVEQLSDGSYRVQKHRVGTTSVEYLPVVLIPISQDSE